jgi:phenylpyruvate tautomerase PptA (4-oxalocrotonate tautomerase family)
MPTYTVTVPRGQLDASQKTRIAQGITRVHSETTGVLIERDPYRHPGQQPRSAL